MGTSSEKTSERSEVVDYGSDREQHYAKNDEGLVQPCPTLRLDVESLLKLCETGLTSDKEVRFTRQCARLKRADYEIG